MTARISPRSSSLLSGLVLCLLKGALATAPVGARPVRAVGADQRLEAHVRADTRLRDLFPDVLPFDALGIR